MTQAEFASALGAETGSRPSSTQISDWETGRAQPLAHILIAAAQVARVSIDQLVGMADPDRLYKELELLRARVERLEGGVSVQE